MSDPSDRWIRERLGKTSSGHSGVKDRWPPPINKEDKTTSNRPSNDDLLQTGVSNAATPTAAGSIEPSIGDMKSAATLEASDQDEGGAVFYIDNGHNNMTDVSTSSVTQFEKLRRENIELARRQSEAEETIQKLRQESTDEIQRLRTESEEFRQSEIERILTEATNKHKEEMKQRLADVERENEKSLQKTIAGLAEKDKQLKELQDKLAQAEATPQLEEEIKRLNAKLDERDVQLKDHVVTVQELNTEIEILKADLAQWKKQAEELVKRNEEKTTTTIHEKDLKIRELQQKLVTIRENDETENLNAEIKLRDEKIKLLEDEAKSRIPVSQTTSSVVGEGGAPDASMNEVVAVLTAKVDQLESDLKHKDKMMQRSKDHIAKMTVPSSVPEGSVDDPQQEGGSRTAPQLHSSGSEGNGTLFEMQAEVLVQGSVHAEGERKHGKSKEQEIQGSPKLIAKAAALRVDVKRKDIKIANLTRQLQSLTQTAEELAKIKKHSKTQSKVIADLKGQLEQHKAETEKTKEKQLLKIKESIVTQVDKLKSEMELRFLEVLQPSTTLTPHEREMVVQTYPVPTNEESCSTLSSQYQKHGAIQSLMELEEKTTVENRKWLQQLATFETERRTAMAKLIEESESSQNQLETRLAQRDEEIAQLQKKISILQSDAMDKEQLKLSEQQLKQQVSELLVEQQQTEHKCQQLQKQVRDHQSTIETLEKEKEGLVQRASELEIKKHYLEQAVISHKSVTENQKQELESRISVLQTEKQEAIAALDEEKQNAAYFTAALKELTDSIEAEKKEMTERCGKLYELSSASIKQLQEQIKWLNRQVLQWCQTEVLQKMSKPSDQLQLQPFVIKEAFQLGSVIGGGCYGAVYSSTIDGDITCIAKRIHDIFVGRSGHQGVSDEEKQSNLLKFQRECTILSTARHPNVVQFMGVHLGSDEYDLSLIMEHLATDLEHLLVYCDKKGQTFKLSLSYQVSFIADIVSGLQYLHGQSIVHRDLNSRNVLLTADLRAKIADLGVSKLHQDPNWFKRLTKAPGAHDYMPPEALSDKPVYDEKIDVFSFGVLSLYIALQKYPTPSQEHVPARIHRRGKGEIHKRNEWLDLLKAQQQRQDKHPFYKLIKQCLLVKEKRPDTTRVVEIVQGMCGAHVCTIEETLNMFVHFHDLLRTKQ